MIGVVGPEAAADRLATAVSGSVETGDAGSVLAAGPELVVAHGDDALGSLVRAGVQVPVLPVDADPGLDPVAAADAPQAVERARSGALRTCTRPVLDVEIEGERVARCLLEAMLVTAEPARISEYAVETPDGTDRIRADGVVIATPAGSHGYARAVGGPVLDRDAASLVVVPVAAFAIRPTIRVTGEDATLTLEVERDEGAISLLADGSVHRSVPSRRPVTVGVGSTVETLLPGRLEKL